MIAYAARIVEIVESNLMPLPMPIDSFTRVPEIEVGWVMRSDLHQASRSLSRFINTFRSKAAGSKISKETSGRSQSNQGSQQQISQNYSNQQMLMRGFSLA